MPTIAGKKEARKQELVPEVREKDKLRVEGSRLPEDALREMHESGLTNGETADQFGVSKALVEQRKRAAKLRCDTGRSYEKKTRDEDVEAAWRAACSVREMAEMLGISASGARQRLDDLDLPAPMSNRLTKEDYERVHGEKLTEEEAGRALGVSASTVCRNWKKHGLEPHHPRSSRSGTRSDLITGLTRKDIDELTENDPVLKELERMAEEPV